MQQDGFHVVGTSAPRVDGYDKVTGRALYTDDLNMSGQLYAGCVHSKQPHATVVVDTSAALAVPGVVKVLVEADFPKPQSRYDWFYCTSHPRFCGDVLAVVVAETPAALEAGIAAVRVKYEKLPAVFTVADALAPDAPQVRAEGVALSDDGVPDPTRPGNVFLGSFKPLRKGDLEAGFAAADHIMERTYDSPYVEHAYLEPESVLVSPEGADVVLVRASSQQGHGPQEFIADALQIPMSRVRAVSTVVGGSFGSKFELVGLMCGRAAVAMAATGRPVKMTYTREDSLLESTKRHPFTTTIRVGAKADGTLTAYRSSQVENAGAYNNQAPWMNIRARVHSAGPYDIPNIRTDTFAVYTNNTVPGAFRGYSSPQVIFANEMAIDDLADELGISVLDLKRRNLLRRGSITATGQQLVHETLLVDMMEDIVRDTGYEEKTAAYATETGTWRHGIGLVTAYRGAALGGEGVDASGAMMIGMQDGSFVLRPTLMEFGQGLNTVYAQIAAEASGVALADIRVETVDTTIMADSGLTVASRGTPQGGHAVRMAGEAIRAMIEESARMMLGAGPDEAIEVRDSVAWVAGSPERSVRVSDIWTMRRYTGQQLSTYQWYAARPLVNDNDTGQGEAFQTYAYGCCVAEVSVNTTTGEVVVDKVSAYHDVGHALNPALVRGQIYGGILMGMGFGLYEEYRLDQGVSPDTNLDAYPIATAKDAPIVDIKLYECADPEGTYGAKSIAENASEMIGAACALAVKHAIKRPVRRVPLTPEYVLELLARGEGCA